MKTNEQYLVMDSKPLGLEIRSNLILLMCLGYLFQFVFHDEKVDFIVSGIVVIVFLTCLWSAKPVPRYISMVMFFVGIWIHFTQGESGSAILQEVTVNLPLLSLIILVPLLSIPIRLEGYFESMQFFLKRYLAQEKKMFALVSLFLFCLSPFLNLGSIRVLHEMIEDLRMNPIFLAKAYIVGFSAAVLWSPYSGSLALVLHYLHIPILSYVPFGLALGVVLLTMGHLLFALGRVRKLQEKEVDEKSSVGEEGERAYHLGKIKQLGLTLVVFMGIIFSIEYATGWPMMFLVSAASILYPLLWCITKSKWPETRELFGSYKAHSVPVMNNEIVLFLSAGIFGKAMAKTEAASGISRFLDYVTAQSILLLIITVVLSMVLITFLGIHQIVIATALILQMNPEQMGIRPEALAVLFMMSWSISAVLSPFNPLNLLVCHSTKQSPLSVGLRWNGVYVAFVFLIGTAFIYLIK